MKTNLELVPLLVVQGAAKAIDFYVAALGAKVVARYEHGSARHLSHADLVIGDVPIALTEELRAWNSEAPPSLGGSPVVLQLFVDDAEATLASLKRAGATVVFPVQEFVGERMARVRDPFGHLWLLRQVVDRLSVDEIQRRRDELFARHAPQQTHVEDEPRLSDPTAGSQARIHLLIGPVGAGKSTFAQKLATEHEAVHLALDEWMAVLFRADRPEVGLIEWYAERAARCVEQIWLVTKRLLEARRDVILEIGLLQRLERERFYGRLHDVRLAVTTHVIDASRDVRRERVEERNRTQGSTFSMVVPPAIFELASDLWEPPDADECAGRDVRFVRTDATRSRTPRS